MWLGDIIYNRITVLQNNSKITVFEIFPLGMTKKSKFVNVGKYEQQKIETHNQIQNLTWKY